MKNHFEKYLSKEEWWIQEEGWNKDKQGVYESNFTLGNGLVGSRGVYEEIPYDAKVGTFLAGVFDRVGSQVSELINIPNPFNFHFTVGGEKIGVVAMDVLENNRTLDMKHGLLTRQTLYSSSHKKRFEYQSMRYMSMADKNVGVMQVSFKPLDGGADLTALSNIDTAVTNSGTITEGRKRHFNISEISRFDDGEYVCVSSLEKGTLIGFASTWTYTLGGKTKVIDDTNFHIRIKKNETITFTKIFVLNYSTDRNFVKMRNATIKLQKNVCTLGMQKLYQAHIKAWGQLWNVAKVSIKGDPETEKALRFNIYHLLICGYAGEGEFSIGARTLSGEGYHGHVFWDSEIFIVPFFTFLFPEMSRHLLLYRFNRLDAAHEIAKKQKYKGAMFPWESGDTGFDETPAWAKDLDGTVIRIHTNEFEHHITADVAYAYYQYYVATGDDQFMLDYGLEMLFETARFWVSRVELNRKTKFYEIKRVIGPDEFHVDVNNNAFTNMLAKWNILIAYKMSVKFKKEYPKLHKSLIAKCKITQKEISEWKQIAPRIAMKMGKDKLIEQHDGFFKKKNVRIKEFDENFMPLFPKTVNLHQVDRYQLVKQADVVMMLFLLSDFFNFKTKKKNYEYYLKRTMHKSSLSPSIYSCVGSEIEDYVNACHFLSVSVNADLKNIHGNSHEGIHAASLGGTWLSVIQGFGGVKVYKNELMLNPKLPEHWNQLSFSIVWRGLHLKIHVEPEKVIVKCGTQKIKGSVPVTVFGQKETLEPKKTLVFVKS